MQKTYQGHKYVDAKQAAQIIGVSLASFRYWKSHDMYIQDLDAMNFGARTFYSVSSVRKLAKSYTPRSRPAKQHSDDIETTLSLILEVLVQLQATIAQFKSTVH